MNPEIQSIALRLLYWVPGNPAVVLPQLLTGLTLRRALHIFLFAGCAWLGSVHATAATLDALFRDGTAAYRAGDYARAARVWREAADRLPASGTLQNLGLAEWHRGETGPAIVTWERALWIDPFNSHARDNLRFARKMAQLEAPELMWYEVVSTWMPVDWWAWIASGSLWLAIGIVTLPNIFRWRKAAWHQAVAALALMIFLLSVPAHAGVLSRSRMGFILEKETPLRLTPTRQGQVITRMAPGEPARLEKSRGRYVLLRTNHTTGWVDQDQFALIAPAPIAR